MGDFAVADGDEFRRLALMRVTVGELILLGAGGDHAAVSSPALKEQQRPRRPGEIAYFTDCTMEWLAAVSSICW